MYGIPDSPHCPLNSFMSYLSHLNPKCQFFWQRPKTIAAGDIWFENAPIGGNTIGHKMKMLSSHAGLSNMYTNYCPRATTVTLLDGKGFEACHITAVSGQKSENSFRNYVRTDEGHKRKMAEAIGNAVTATGPSKRQKGVTDNASDLVQFLEQDPSNGSGNMTEFSSADGLSDMDRSYGPE
ncbi:uncharacterized protein [Argopecten irradians]|uniref:uncharacterized protein n=1 Tax=Argopecten irradians TaxID=31199 RepID=UPI00371CA08A